MPQLDGLRCLAIAGVLVHHLLPVGEYFPPTGMLGVCGFFVLSGFLITRLLLAARERIDTGRDTRRRQLGVFYARRALRIFPVYYAFLAVLLVAGTSFIDVRWPWHAAYLSNWHFTFEYVPGQRLGGMDRHLWTLSVEEQFYLVWPIWLLLSPRRLVVPGLMLAFLAGPSWRALAMFYLDKPGVWAEWPTPANLDLLAGGGLLAVAWGRASKRWWQALFLFGLPGVVMACVWMHVESLVPWWKWFATFNRLAIAICFAGLVGIAAHGIGGVAGQLLTLRPVVYVGTISYGMYLFHVLAAEVVRRVLPELEPAGWLVGLLAITLTIVAATTSWHLFESPINRLKRKVPYQP